MTIVLAITILLLAILPISFVLFLIILKLYKSSEWYKQKECEKTGGHYLEYHPGHGYHPDQYHLCTKCRTIFR